MNENKAKIVSLQKQVQTYVKQKDWQKALSTLDYIVEIAKDKNDKLIAQMMYDVVAVSASSAVSESRL